MILDLTALIKSQGFNCLIMFGGGIAIGMFYSLCSFISHLINLKGWGKIIAELIFWALAALLSSQFLYYCTYGQFNFHCLCAFLLGPLLWKKLFYGTIKSSTLTFKNQEKLRKNHGKEETKSGV
ncbi:MAG: spore cortex biosynthesis protein YabQ [Anaerovoracaceae bacterium]